MKQRCTTDRGRAEGRETSVAWSRQLPPVYCLQLTDDTYLTAPFCSTCGLSIIPGFPGADALTFLVSLTYHRKRQPARQRHRQSSLWLLNRCKKTYPSNAECTHLSSPRTIRLTLVWLKTQKGSRCPPARSQISSAASPASRIRDDGVLAQTLVVHVASVAMRDVPSAAARGGKTKEHP
ncbi:hypothetical protein EDB85DRAFT_309911 [Lactarius pseudohatsudake]|nr:hypothetical protein EDB85DRAFT_309911 [Lactarius pseudohatsudake]